MKNNILFVGIMVLLYSCATKIPVVNEIAFDQPQPVGIDNLREIPNSYIGNYYDNDSNELKIDKNFMTLTYVEVTKISKQEADTTKDWKLEHQYIIVKSFNIKLPYILKGDTLYIKQPVVHLEK
jgi:hypothetical protein